MASSSRSRIASAALAAAAAALCSSAIHAKEVTPPAVGAGRGSEGPNDDNIDAGVDEPESIFPSLLEAGRKRAAAAAAAAPSPAERQESHRRDQQRRSLTNHEVRVVGDFESGTLEGWRPYLYPLNDPIGAGDVEISNSNVPPTGPSNTYSIAAAFVPNSKQQTGEWGGFNSLRFFDNGTATPDATDITGMEAFTFWLDPTNDASAPPDTDYSLEIFMLDGDDFDDFYYVCRVSKTDDNACAAIDGGWQKITIPIADMTYKPPDDPNNPGGDGVLTGPVMGYDFRVNSKSLAGVAFHMDDIEFRGPTPSPTRSPTDGPTVSPTLSPTGMPVTSMPTETPVAGVNTTSPTEMPVTSAPTEMPVTAAPATSAPTEMPVTSVPTEMPVSSSPTPMPVPTTSVPTSSPTTTPPTTAPVTPTTSPTEEPIDPDEIDPNIIDCPKSHTEPCDLGPGVNCCMTNKGNSGKIGLHPLWRLDYGEKMLAGQWLCRSGEAGEYFFGVLDMGTVHTLVRLEEEEEAGEDKCRILWTATEENDMGTDAVAPTNADGSPAEIEDEIPVFGDYIEVDEEGNMGLYEAGGTGQPLWKQGCSMGKKSRIMMTVVREKFENARVVLLRSWRPRSNNRRDKAVRDWSIKRTGEEEVRDCSA